MRTPDEGGGGADVLFKLITLYVNAADLQQIMQAKILKITLYSNLLYAMH